MTSDSVSYILKKVQKDKKFRGLNLGKLERKIQNLSNYAVGLHRHTMTVNGYSCDSYCAKLLNRHTNQTGRGDWRYLTYDNELVGIAKHKPNGRDYQVFVFQRN